MSWIRNLMYGKEWGGVFIKEVIQGRETIGVWDVGVKRSNINGCNEGVGWETGGEGL